MNKKLIWNFEFNVQEKISSESNFPLEVTDLPGPIKWEIRFFWPEHEFCTLNALTESEVNLELYKPKNHEDYYYLIPGYEYNLKKRYDKLFYKPLVHRTERALGFGEKQILEPNDNSSSPANVFEKQMLEQIKHQSIELFVRKEAFVYSFPSDPKTKLELGRVEVLDKIFYTACIEGRSHTLVEHIAQHLAPQNQATDYITFLQELVQA